MRKGGGGGGKIRYHMPIIYIYPIFNYSPLIPSFLPFKLQGKGRNVKLLTLNVGNVISSWNWFP